MIVGDEDAENLFGDNVIAEKGEPAQEEVRITDCDEGRPTSVLEQCGDVHPAPKPALATNPTDSVLQQCEASNDEASSDEEEGDEDEHGAGGHEHCNLETAEIHATTSRHDDWLHRGSLLADLPWLVYMMRVQRVRKPTQADADYNQLFFFDEHYPLSIILY